MGLDRLGAFLRRHRRIALDTSVFIYQVEESPLYLPFTGPVFSWIVQPQSKAVTSTITMTELLVPPYRAPDERQANLYYGLLSTYPNLDWVAPDLEIADLAARLRAAHRLKPPDALQAATAVRTGATGLITNDAVFERIPNFETLVLDHLR